MFLEKVAVSSRRALPHGRGRRFEPDQVHHLDSFICRFCSFFFAVPSCHYRATSFSRWASGLRVHQVPFFRFELFLVTRIAELVSLRYLIATIVTGPHGCDIVFHILRSKPGPGPVLAIRRWRSADPKRICSSRPSSVPFRATSRGLGGYLTDNLALKRTHFVAIGKLQFPVHGHNP